MIAETKLPQMGIPFSDVHPAQPFYLKADLEETGPSETSIARKLLVKCSGVSTRLAFSLQDGSLAEILPGEPCVPVSAKVVSV